jgi:hypothetical protein
LWVECWLLELFRLFRRTKRLRGVRELVNTVALEVVVLEAARVRLLPKLLVDVLGWVFSSLPTVRESPLPDTVHLSVNPLTLVRLSTLDPEAAALPAALALMVLAEKDVTVLVALVALPIAFVHVPEALVNTP